MLRRTHTGGNAHWSQIFISKSFPLEAKLIKRWLRIGPLSYKAKRMGSSFVCNLVRGHEGLQD